MIGPSILHSVSYAGLWGQAFLPIDKFADKAAELGYQGVMLMAKRPHVSVLDYGERERTRLRHRLEKNKLQTVCVAGYTNFTADLEHGDIPHREIQILYVHELARLASDLGGNLVRIFTGYENPAKGFNAQWSLVVESLQECARKAVEFGVIIGIQNHHDIGASSESLHQLIRAVNEPNCRAMFDAWAPALHGDDLFEAARKMGGITVHSTVANYQRLRRFRYDPSITNYVPQIPELQAVAIEDGFIDYRAFFGALCEGGFDGSVAYEICSPIQDGGSEDTLDRYARLFVEFMESLRSAKTAEVSRR
jgi:sugar phosphate isomerase/epimerase